MKKINSEIILGNGSDYRFEFCKIDEISGEMTIGVEENFNEYIEVSSEEIDYVKKLLVYLFKLEKRNKAHFDKISELYLKLHD